MHEPGGSPAQQGCGLTGCGAGDARPSAASAGLQPQRSIPRPLPASITSTLSASRATRQSLTVQSGGIRAACWGHEPGQGARRRTHPYNNLKWSSGYMPSGRLWQVKPSVWGRLPLLVLSEAAVRRNCILHLVQEPPEGGVLFRPLHAELLQPVLQRLLLQALEQGCMVGSEPRPQHLSIIDCEQRMCHGRVWLGQISSYQGGLNAGCVRRPHRM